jgi:CSLREA domain-containing protein
MTTAIRPLSLAFAGALVAAALLLSLHDSQQASAAVYTVTNTSDSADGACDGNCSLREAVMAANANISTIDTISIPPGTYTLTLNAAENALNPAAMRDLDLLNNNTTINGAGAAATIIDANYIDRVFEVHLNKVVTISNLTIQRGAPIGQGGGLTAAGGSTVTLNNVVIAENQANDGGGIWNGGSMTIAASTVRDNIGNNGGGIFSGSNAYLLLNQVALHGNQAGGLGGGGLYNDNTANIWNSTISDNFATNSGGGGGGILNYNTTDLNLQNVTISNNSSSSSDKGGGIRNFGSLDIWNSIVANNAGGGGNCSPVGPYSQVAINSLGDNIDWGAANCGLGALGDMNANPNLGALQNNGGPTATRALLPGSAAIDAETHGGDCFPTDQRGVARPQGPACDIGAFEAGAAGPTPTPSPTPPPTPTPSPSPTPTPPPTSDTDGDGWTAAAEGLIGTNPSDPCGGAAWPADLYPGGIQPNTLNIQDLGSFLTPVRHLGTSQGEPGFNARWDLIPGSTVGKHINITDIASLVTGATGYPPMCGGTRAYGQTCPFPP